MRITVVGFLVVIGGILLLAFVVKSLTSGPNETSKIDDQPNPSTT
jgi:hypothetical protein